MCTHANTTASRKGIYINHNLSGLHRTFSQYETCDDSHIVLWTSELLQFIQDGFTGCMRGLVCAPYVVGNLKENFKGDTPNENKDKSSQQYTSV